MTKYLSMNRRLSRHFLSAKKHIPGTRILGIPPWEYPAVLGTAIQVQLAGL